MSGGLRGIQHASSGDRQWRGTSKGWRLPGSLSFSSWRSCDLVASDEKNIWGWFFVILGSVFFIGYLFFAIFSKVMPPSDNAIISAMQNDWYYCFLVPLTLPIIMVSVYFHWLSMKMFKHA